VCPHQAKSQESKNRKNLVQGETAKIPVKSASPGHNSQPGSQKSDYPSYRYNFCFHIAIIRQLARIVTMYVMEKKIAERLLALANSRFRASFHLSAADMATVRQKGLPTIRQHASELLAKRLFPTSPQNDGKQTPMRGYPVFVAQHATATCCRNCLWKWHKIPIGRELTAPEQEYVLNVVEAWIRQEVGN
jgi:hypothetical protein